MVSITTKIIGGISAAVMLLMPFTPLNSARRKFAAEQTADKTVMVTKEEADAKNSEINETIRNDFPGVVCWGDSLTYGAGGHGTSYPNTIEKLIRENILDKYDLKKQMNASDKSDVDWSAYSLRKIAVMNMGVGGERSDTICGRAGVIPFTVEAVTIPKSGGKVPVTFEVKDGQQVAPLLQGDGGVNPVTLGGIRGRLSYTSIDEETVQYYFSTSPDDYEETLIEAGTEMTCAAADKYLNYIQVIMMGGNGGHNTLDELIAQYDKMLERQEENGDRYIIVGYHGTLGALTRYPDVEKRFKAEYGEHYVSLADYFFSEDALNDAGIEITDEIRAELDAGKCPKVFLEDAVHFNATGYELVGKLVYERMDKLGYFDEIKTAIGLK